MSTVKKIPTRKCTGCGELKPKKELVRVIKDSENNISIDLTGKMNGRGAYICKNDECLKKAIKTKALDRSFKMAVDAKVYEQLKVELGNEQ